MDESNTKGLDQIIKLLSGSDQKARVGVLGSTNSREGFQTNAEIGMVHEYGLGHVAERSFLRVPIMDNFQKYLEKQKIPAEVVEKCMKQNSLEPLLNLFGIVGVRISLDAFKTKGFGKWPEWKDPDYTNATGELLQDTTQLRESITWDVK